MNTKTKKSAHKITWILHTDPQGFFPAVINNFTFLEAVNLHLHRCTEINRQPHYSVFVLILQTFSELFSEYLFK